jgi:hypothetical protein
MSPANDSRNENLFSPDASYMKSESKKLGQILLSQSDASENPSDCSNEKTPDLPA